MAALKSACEAGNEDEVGTLMRRAPALYTLAREPSRAARLPRRRRHSEVPWLLCSLETLFSSRRSAELLYLGPNVAFSDGSTPCVARCWHTVTWRGSSLRTQLGWRALTRASYLQIAVRSFEGARGDAHLVAG